MTITSAISDLFFNHDTVNYKTLYLRPDSCPTRDEVYDAVKLDAQQFIDLLSAVTGHQYDAAELAEDFIGRV